MIGGPGCRDRSARETLHLTIAALLAWGAVTALLLVSGWQEAMSLDLSDADDAMRMAQIRDLVAGQGWWDLYQYRVAPLGGGEPMHWSRIVDAPIAGLILLLRPLIGQPLAEQMVMIAWPPLMGGALAVTCALGFRNLDDRRIAWLTPLLLIMMGFTVMRFRPMHVDHHGWQILLAALMLCQAIRRPSWQAGIVAGLCGSALLAVSIEGLPIVAVFAALAAFRWALHGRAGDANRLCGYMAALAGGALAFQFLTRGPHGVVDSWCDALSAPYLGALLVSAAGVLAFVRAAPRTAAIRLSLLAGTGLMAAGVLVGIDPQCAKGPFAALPPVVVEYWYKDVLEGQPIWASQPQDIPFMLLPSIMGLLGSALAWRASASDEDRRIWTTLLVALVGATAVSLFVMRSVATAHVYALPGCAWLLLYAWTCARQIPLTSGRVLASVAVTLVLPLPASIVTTKALAAVIPAFAPKPKETKGAVSFRKSCLTSATIAALDRLPAEKAMVPLDFGPSLLFWTHHSVVATGHHRNGEAMADAIRTFIATPDAAEALVRKHGATLVVYCGVGNDLILYRKRHKNGLAALLDAGRTPNWLEPVINGGHDGLSVWRVEPAR